MITRSLPLVILALLNLILFGLAGIFSSEVTKAAGNETLVISPSCGTWSVGPSSTIQNNTPWRIKTVNDTKSADSYARDCYGGTGSSFDCSQYVQSRLPWTVDRNASCPFSDGICKGGAAYKMDTGIIDSHDHLGINTPKSERVSYRKVTTCSPIRATGYGVVENTTDALIPTNVDIFQYFYYGPTPSLDQNYTYKYDVLSGRDLPEYSLTYVSHPAAEIGC